MKKPTKKTVAKIIRVLIWMVICGVVGYHIYKIFTDDQFYLYLIFLFSKLVEYFIVFSLILLGLKLVGWVNDCIDDIDEMEYLEDDQIDASIVMNGEERNIKLRHGDVIDIRQIEQLLCPYCNGKGEYIDTHPERYGLKTCQCQQNNTHNGNISVNGKSYDEIPDCVVVDGENSQVSICCAKCLHFGKGDNWPCNDCLQYVHFKPKQDA